MMDQRTCKKCGKPKPISGFQKTYGDHYRYECRSCVNARSRSYYNEEAIEKKWDYKLRERYGITADQYRLILAAQGGGCAICGTTENKGRRLGVDHCHDSGRVRGILCDDCNFGIGKFKNDVSFVERAVRYLTGQLEHEEVCRDLGGRRPEGLPV